MQEAYTAGAASRDAEIEGWRKSQQENLRWQCHLQAAVFRKDALLQRVLDALKGLRQGDVAVWSLGGSDRSNTAITTIKEELSK